jgi:stage V sporulation protein SpoVS
MSAGMFAPRTVLLAQGGYYVATGVAPFLSRRRFERVTGPKLEWWLVQTAGVLVTSVGAGILSAVLRRRDTPEIAGIAAGCAAGLAAVDVVHVVRGRIAPVYLADAAVELALLAGSPVWRGRGAPAA